VLVGYDGSDQAIQALHYAATMALGIGCRLTVVSAFTVPVMVYPNMASLPPVPEDEARAAASRQVAAGALPHLEGYPGEVALESVQGDAAGVLVELSALARLAVVEIGRASCRERAQIAVGAGSLSGRRHWR